MFFIYDFLKKINIVSVSSMFDIVEMNLDIVQLQRKISMEISFCKFPFPKFSILVLSD